MVLGRVTLGTSEVEKDLGILMDSVLKFSKDVEEQVNKANRILGLTRRSYQYLDIEKESINNAIYCSCAATPGV